MSATQWSAFVGVTGIALSLFLALARVSQGLVRDDPPAESAADDDHQPSDRTTDDASPGATTDGDGAVPSIDPDVSDENTDADRWGEATGPATTTSTPVPAPAPQEPDRPADPDSPPRPRGLQQVEEVTLSPGALLANVALTQGLFGVIVAAAAVYFAIPPSALGLSGEPLSTGWPALALGVGFGVVLWLGNELASGVADAAGAGYDETLRTMLAPDSTRGWLLLLGVTLPLIAGVEELLFRAAAIGVPAAAYATSPWPLAVVSSLAFAVGHGAQGRVGMVVTGALGFALAGGFVLTGSFLVVVVAHYLVNALEFLLHERVGLPDPVWTVGT